MTATEHTEGGGEAATAISLNLILEEHLGHRTYAENLRVAAGEDRPDLHWGAVTYTLRDRPWHRFGPARNLAASWAGRQEVREALRHHADVNVFNTQVPAALAGSRARATPYVVVTDITPRQYDGMAEAYGHSVDRLAPLRWWKQRVNEQVFQRAACCVGWSEWTRASIVDDYGVRPDRIEVVPPGADLLRWQPVPKSDDGTIRILFVGADFERKGGADLLAAFAMLPAHVELVLVTKSVVPRADRVRVIDDLEPNDSRLVELFRGSDIFALPTHAEAFGIAAAEASAAGLPVVASRVGGLPDIVLDGETGFTVGAGEPHELAAALRALIDDPDLRRRFGAAARRHAEKRFDARRNAATLFALARSSVSL